MVSVGQSMAARSAADHTLVALAACMGGASVLAILHLASLGFGSSIDTHGMIETWQRMALEGHYRPSRFQGSPIPELVIGYAASLGGHLASNLVSIGLSALQLACLAILLASLGIERWKVALVLLVVATNPYWIVSAATSDDGAYGLSFFLVGLLLAARGSPVLAALALAAAGGSRISYAPLGLIVLALGIYHGAGRRALWAQALLVYAVVGGLLYLPAFIDSRLGLAFLHPAYPDQQGWLGLVARAAYKAFRLFGFLASALILAAVAYRTIHKEPDLASPERLAVRFATLVVLYHAVLFLRIPAEVNYLLACVPAVAVIVVLLAGSRRLAVGLAGLQLLYWLVALEPAEIRHEETGECGAVVATGASFRPHVGQGVLLAEIDGMALRARCLGGAGTALPRDGATAAGGPPS